MTSSEETEYRVEGEARRTSVTAAARTGSGWGKAVRFLGVVLLMTAVTVGLQWKTGVYESELNGYADEAAHLITGMMVRDYLVTGLGSSPLAFAEDYYLHYPKVGFGIWPPLYHFVEAIWFLVTPPGKTSAFVLQGLITGTLAACVTWMALPYGWWIALAAGLGLIGLPTVQTFTGMVMADNLMCLIAFLAAMVFRRYGEYWQQRDLYGFGLLAGLALMTKSNAAGLGLLPVVSLGLLREWRRIVSVPMVVAGGVALVVALPWQLLVMRFWTSATSANRYSLEYALMMLKVHLSMYMNMPGVVVLTLALYGIGTRVVLAYWRGKVEAKWASLSGLVVGMFLFGLAPLPPEPRYHVGSMAGMLVFAAAALWDLARWAEGRWGRWAGLGTIGLVGFLYLVTTPEVTQRPPVGYGEVARRIAEDPAYRDAVVLVSSENMGEGMLISEIAPLELRPSRYVLRATKMLSRSRWNLDRYELLYKDAGEMERFLESVPVKLLVYDTTQGVQEMPHHRVLGELLKQRRDRWRLVGEFPQANTAAGGKLFLYELLGEDGKPRKPIQIDMKYTLQRVLGQNKGQ
jgi:4-amino-4-deoxy-L-arabinose transferase-like glycosyltransferase